ncbi:MAG: Na/Pi cotransporter family protein, partial [Desulfobacterales bacterium]|nr:Na/Pi cotransporter family protein [Desulfobacterales bacterium]
MDLLGLLSFLSGILIFVYGILKASRRLENIVSFRLRNFLITATKSRLRPLMGGFGLTLLTQSSSATSVIVITLVSSGLVALPAALIMILGAGVGATLTVQLIAFDIYDWSIVICGLGICIRLFARSGRGKNFGEGLFYFALIFLGMQIMSTALAPLKDSPLSGQILGNLLTSPFAGIFLATIFTALIQTSAATLGIVISLVMAGVINMETALSLALGANIGTCVTAVISSLGGNTVSRHVAYGFVLIKIAGVIIIFPFISMIAGWLPELAQSPARQVAHFHTIFNLFLLVFVPVSGYIASLLEKLMPARLLGPEEFGPKYLDSKALISPGMALAHAHREVIRMADIVETMLRQSIKAFEGADQDCIEKIEKSEGEVDILNREIKRYLTQVSQANITPEQSQREMALITFTVNLEHIADIIETGLMGKARKRLLKGVEFSREGRKDIEDFHWIVLNNFNTALGAFVENDFNLARQVQDEKHKSAELEWELRQAHINRLHDSQAQKELSATIDISSLYMDILRDLQLINAFISNIIYPIIEAGAP